MKRVLQFGFAALALSQVAAVAGPGDLVFQNNKVGSSTVIPIFDVDGTTKLVGSTYKVGLYVAGGSTTTRDGVNVPTLGAQVGSTIGISTSTTGRFSGGTQVVPGGNAGGTVQLVVIAWDSVGGTVDFANATKWGYSTVFASPTLGGDDDNNVNTIPVITSAMADNFKSFSLVPEPSTYALAALGLGGLLFISRRK